MSRRSAYCVLLLPWFPNVCGFCGRIYMSSQGTQPFQSLTTYILQIAHTPRIERRRWIPLLYAQFRHWHPLSPCTTLPNGCPTSGERIRNPPANSVHLASSVLNAPSLNLSARTSDAHHHHGHTGRSDLPSRWTGGYQLSPNGLTNKFLRQVSPSRSWAKPSHGNTTSNTRKWKPNQDSKVYRPFYKPPVKGYRHHKHTGSPVQYMHVKPKDYIALRCTHIENVLLCQLTKATELAAREADQMQHPWQELVPLKYYCFGKVFSDKEAQQFPRECPWDHAIDLVDDTPSMLNCKTYPLAEGQQKLLDKFIADHLKKGYICQSNSPYTSPFFFISKKDGKQHPVQVYHKFDIYWGYNNVHIKKGDKWKAAFKTNRGLFKPIVMFFGLTNSSATFQIMMDATFKEITSGDVIIYINNILIAIKESLRQHQALVTHVLKKL